MRSLRGRSSSFGSWGSLRGSLELPSGGIGADFFVVCFCDCRALSLWAVDHTLTIALDVCKAFLEPINFLTKLWPCPGALTSLLLSLIFGCTDYGAEQRRRYEQLVEQLRIACMSVEASEGSAGSSF